MARKANKISTRWIRENRAGQQLFVNYAKEWWDPRDLIPE